MNSRALSKNEFKCKGTTYFRYATKYMGEAKPPGISKLIMKLEQ